MTNTDESEFSRTRPGDGEKFSTLIAEHLEDWVCSVFSVKDYEFPNDIGEFDGFIITGSPASVHGEDPWIERLFELIRDIEVAKIPMFGACFGHQAIALALGGKVSRNPGGWVHGLAQVDTVGKYPFLSDTPETFGTYASHIEQVSQMPAGAEIIAAGPGCKIGGYVLDRHVFTTQYHPEMTDGFITDLVEEVADYVGKDVTETARESLKGSADRTFLGEQITCFFEWAVAD
ncbi:MAG: type 1 glutamine amidotransferase [Paracoccaceae bacterium]|nr:type 1 glutamine amidotransferase [Paracoccaceae bacterium]